jgi:hypothetical protein
MRLRLFSKLNVINATGRKRKRNMSVRKPQANTRALVERYRDSLKNQMRSETVRSVSIAVCREPERGKITDEVTGEDILDFESPDDEDGAFLWRFDPELSKDVIAQLQPLFPRIQFQARNVTR